MPHVTVIGAGITGVTTADALLQRGHAVTMIERHAAAAMETSFANGGQLSASNAEVWNHPSTLLKGLRWMFRHDAPLLLNPWPDWHKVSWLAEFAAAMGDYRKNTIATVRLALRARELLLAIAARDNIAFDLERRGILHIYTDPAALAHGVAVNDLLRAGGLERRAVSAEEIRTIEPALGEGYVGGLFTPSDATGDIHAFTEGLAASCARRGARLVFDAAVGTIAPGRGEVVVNWSDTRPGHPSESAAVDGVVICAGTESRALAASVGDRVNIYPVKGYSLTVHLDDARSQQAAPWVSILDDSAKVVSSRFGRDRLRIAGTAEFSGFNRDIRPERIKPLLAWTQQHFPAVDTRRVEPWAGLRPMLPDMMPRVGPGRQAGVFYNTGHGHLGWTLAAATAEIVAAAIDHNLPPK